MDRKRVLDWLKRVYINPRVTYIQYTDEEIKLFAHDALVLLKEKESLKPNLKAGGWYCGNRSCRTLLGAGGSQREDEKTKAYALFCRKCGKKVKWDA